jgi:hypothetical protein
MDVHIGRLDAEVTAVDDRTLLSPEVLDVVVRTIVARLEREMDADRRHADDVAMWPSVRARGSTE